MTWHALRVPGGEASDAWAVDVPVPSAHPEAARRRDLELRRTTDGHRRVLLRYADGATDLVVVANRARYDAAALRELSEGGSPDPAGIPVIPATPSTPDWGLPDGGPPGWCEIPVTEPGDTSTWAGALDAVLTVYGGREAVSLRFCPEEMPGEYLPCTAPETALTFSVFRDSRGWVLRCDFLATHVDPAIARQFTRHLHSAHASGEVMDEAERDRVVALGRSPLPRTVPMTIPQAYQQIATAQPDAVALTDGTDTWTYQELDERSDVLARGLRARGVASGDRVGVCLERGAELVAVLLAVMKAGAAYVPMDPAYPVQRLAFTAEDAGLHVIVSRSEQFPGVSPDDLTGAAELTEGDSGDAAYVIYTSGSTGRPKGVVVPHRNVIALVDATRDTYRLGADDVWTWFHSAAFDFSVWEIWGCLLTGGRLVVVPYFVSREPGTFRDLLVSEQVTVLSQTPSAFAQLLADRAPGRSGAARRVRRRATGRPDAAAVARPASRLRAGEHVRHHRDDRARHGADRHPAAGAGRVAVGGTGTARLAPVRREPVRRPAATGSGGRDLVGGAGVADGYLGRDELTAQRFRPDPFGDGRVYRSGDLGRLRPDGTLDHLGRIDGQVKLRGFRIELDEIRAVLLEDPAVRAAAVVLRQEDPADAATARLDAYVVLESGTATEVRGRAARLLPEHMVPAAVTALDALPLTPNGKLDVAMLPAPVAVEVEEGGDLTARLRAIWSTVLGAEVGLDDDFFDLGGNSLLAVRLGSAMRAGGLPDVRLRELYRHPTISSLVASLA